MQHPDWGGEEEEEEEEDEEIRKLCSGLYTCLVF